MGKGAKTGHALVFIVATPSALCSTLGKPLRLVVGKRKQFARLGKASFCPPVVEISKGKRLKNVNF